MKNKTILLVVIMFFIMITPAYAHKPIFEDRNSSYDNPIVISDHKISYAVYGELKTKEDVDFIKFKGKKGDTFYIQMTIPIIKENTGFKPYIALIGKGIYQKDSVPFEIPKDFGVIVLPPGPLESFYEKFTQTSYNLSQSTRGELPEDGDYYVAIFSMDRGGKYSLAIGEKEKFNFIDIIKFPYTYLKVKYFFNPLATIIISLGVILIIAAVIRIIKVRR
jgi:hypothetical protein